MEDKSNINFDDKHEMFELCQEKPIDQKILHNVSLKQCFYMQIFK